MNKLLFLDVSMNFRFGFTLCLISTCLLTVLAACSVTGSFQPIPPMFQNWEKSGTTPDDVKKALLVCGYDNPFTGFDARKEVSLNERARITKCMRDDAFLYLAAHEFRFNVKNIITSHTP